MEATPQTSGKFEVTVDGTLVHSKDAGDGFVDNNQKFRKIQDAVDKALD